MRITNMNMDTRFGNPDPWGSDRDVANHAARDERAAEAGKAIDEILAASAGRAVLRPELTAPHLTVAEPPMKRDREALRRREKRVFFGKRA